MYWFVPEMSACQGLTIGASERISGSPSQHGRHGSMLPGSVGFLPFQVTLVSSYCFSRHAVALMNSILRHSFQVRAVWQMRLTSPLQLQVNHCGVNDLIDLPTAFRDNLSFDFC